MFGLFFYSRVLECTVSSMISDNSRIEFLFGIVIMLCPGEKNINWHTIEQQLIVVNLNMLKMIWLIHLIKVRDKLQINQCQTKKAVIVTLCFSETL